MKYPFYPIGTYDDRGRAKRLRRWLASRGIEARVEKRWSVRVHPEDYDYARRLLEAESEYDGPPAKAVK